MYNKEQIEKIRRDYADPMSSTSQMIAMCDTALSLCEKLEQAHNYARACSDDVDRQRFAKLDWFYKYDSLLELVKWYFECVDFSVYYMDLDGLDNYLLCAECEICNSINQAEQDLRDAMSKGNG